MFSKQDIEKYFAAEKAESVVFIAIGLAAIVAALAFFFLVKTNFYKGAAIPLLLIGLLLGIIGITVYKKSDADRQRNVYAYDMNPAALKEKEIPRMETVMKNFVFYRYTELLLAIAGIVLFFSFNNQPNGQFGKGIGAGLALMAMVALTTDYFAEKRGGQYIEGLKTFTSKPVR